MTRHHLRRMTDKAVPSGVVCFTYAQIVLGRKLPKHAEVDTVMTSPRESTTASGRRRATELSVCLFSCLVCPAALAVHCTAAASTGSQLTIATQRSNDRTNERTDQQNNWLNVRPVFALSQASTQFTRTASLSADHRRLRLRMPHSAAITVLHVAATIRIPDSFDRNRYCS